MKVKYSKNPKRASRAGVAGRMARPRNESRLLRGRRKLDREVKSRALPLLGIHLQVSAHRLDQLTADGEPKP